MDIVNLKLLIIGDSGTGKSRFELLLSTKSSMHLQYFTLIVIILFINPHAVYY